jgi:hypothetical protein
MNARTDLTAQVIALIQETPGLTVDELLDDCPGFTRRKIMTALQWAKNTGRLRGECQGMREEWKTGRKPDRYYPVEPKAAPTARPPSSIWEYAAITGSTA